MSPLNDSYGKILQNREPFYIEPYEDGLRVFFFFKFYLIFNQIAF